MPKLIDYAKKEFKGSAHWFDAKDWSLLYAGSKAVDDLLSIPTPELEAYGWYKIAHDMSIDIPVVRRALRTDGKPGWDYNSYWLVTLDFEFYLERQLRDLVSLKVDEEDLPELQRQVTQWTSDRLDKRKKDQFYRDAESLASQLGIPVEEMLAKLNQPVVPTQPITTTIVRGEEKILVEPESKTDVYYPTGTFVMLGNESFLEIDKGNGVIDRYKLESKTVLAGLLKEESVTNPRELVGKRYRFDIDADTPCKSSRKPKGWVKEIVW